MAEWKHTAEAAAHMDAMGRMQSWDRQVIIKLAAKQLCGGRPRAKLVRAKPVRPRKTR